MDHQQEYHDPDYPGTSACVKEEPPSLSEEEKSEKIKSIIRREFTNELEVRENEIMLIDQRMITSRRMLHRLRYALVNSYYRDQKLQLGSSQIQDEVAAQHEPRARNEVASLLRDGQRRLHPSVRKLLGKQTADLDEILFRSRAPRNKARKDYSAMVQSRNYTIAADTTKSLRPDRYTDAKPEDAGSSRPKKVPRHLEPKILNVVTLDEATRNQMKYRYRIIIGNTSKYAPPASRADRSTHKWLLYVRGPPAQPDLSRVVSRVSVRLHHSYAPHHTVHIDKPPFHISRRGWGEFPAKVELHFTLPERNRPATVEHTIKLDRNYTGLQTLGGETIVDVWLYSTQEMLPYEYTEDIETNIHIDTPVAHEDDAAAEMVVPKPEPIEMETVNDTEQVVEDDTQADNWLDFFSNATELDVDEMIIKPVKKPDERNDLESLIDTNVIPKENSADECNDETEISTKEIQELDCSNIRTEVQEDWLVSSNHKSIENPTEDLPNELLTQPTSPKKRIMKYMDPTTGKIYYLEMDRNLDLSKVQEIVINSKGNIKTAKISPIKANGLKNVRKNSKKGGVSLLKPEVKSLLKTENNTVKIDKQKSILKSRSYTHIENDHCYLGAVWAKNVTFSNNVKENSVLPVKSPSKDNSGSEVIVKKEQSVYDCLCSALVRMTSVRVAVNYMLKKIPIICGEARDPDYVRCFPFVVENEDKYWRLDFAKRRNIEWSRAKLINKLLTEFLNTPHEQIWRTKQILIYSRLHGYFPVRTEALQREPENDPTWSSWTDLDSSRKIDTNIKQLYPQASDIDTLTVFNSEEYLQNTCDAVELIDSDEDIEIVKCDDPVKVKKEVLPDKSDGLIVLPVEDEDDRLRFMFIERMCADIGIELRNEDVGNGYSYSAVHAVMLSAVRGFAEELVRSALACKLAEGRAEGLPPVWTGSSTMRATVALEHAYGGARSGRARVLTARGLAVERKETHFI